MKAETDSQMAYTWITKKESKDNRHSSLIAECQELMEEKMDCYLASCLQGTKCCSKRHGENLLGPQE